MANKSVSLVIIFCILLGSHYLLSRSSAARILYMLIPFYLYLFFLSFADDDHSRIWVGRSMPKRDGSWTSNSSPLGNILLSPPAFLRHIAADTMVVTSNGTNSNQNPRQRP
ncbi:hypothetical protein ACJRO7_028412 [Eucalyptus globulus]|uniref:Uncharacterized protein n=1 Tax=Eucalyptus globulus TaxID=34317 RepID=A0ABD3JWV4_EUCGL